MKRAKTVCSNMSQVSMPVNRAPSLKKEKDLEEVEEEYSDASSNTCYEEDESIIVDQ